MFVEDGVDVLDSEASGEEDEIGEVKAGLVVARHPQAAGLQVEAHVVAGLVRTPGVDVKI
jgi:hypothetical protein